MILPKQLCVVDPFRCDLGLDVGQNSRKGWCRDEAITRFTAEFVGLNASDWFLRHVCLLACLLLHYVWSLTFEQ